MALVEPVFLALRTSRAPLASVTMLAATLVLLEEALIASRMPSRVWLVLSIVTLKVLLPEVICSDPSPTTVVEPP